METIDIEHIRQVIETAYIEGIHGDQDRSKIGQGFHKDFSMIVKTDNTVEKVDMGEWLSRIESMKKQNPGMWDAKTRYTAESIDVTKDAAIAKLTVFKGDVYFSTDYMLLYRLGENWKIVAKIFQ